MHFAAHRCVLDGVVEQDENGLLTKAFVAETRRFRQFCNTNGLLFGACQGLGRACGLGDGVVEKEFAAFQMQGARVHLREEEHIVHNPS